MEHLVQPSKTVKGLAQGHMLLLGGKYSGPT